MSEVIVYSIPGSPYGRAVLATLEEKGAAYRLSPLAPGQHKAEPHLSRHPFGRVPAIEHDGFSLYETQAILRYIDRVFSGAFLSPADPRRAARMDQAMAVNDWYLFPVARALVFHRVVGPRVLGLKPDEAAIAEAVPQAKPVFAELARLLGDKPYFAGEEVSLADLLLAAHLDMFAMTPEWAELGARHQNLVDWLERMNQRPSLQATTWERVSEMAKAA